MEKHKCKLCFKSYTDGRALGGHMRSHMMNLPIQSKPEPPPPQPSQLRNEFVSPSLSSSSSSDDEQEKGLLNYGLRENPKKSFRLADPEFASAGGSVVLQDRESETESSKNLTRRRSKRTRKVNISHSYYNQCKKIGKAESSWAADQEPMSSVSDTTTELEDVAYCLMMLSKDKWTQNQIDDSEEQEQEIDERENSYESNEIELSKITRTRGKYKCETCNKLFKSYQALGGHRASHKKLKLTTNTTTTSTILHDQMELKNGGTTSSSMAVDRKIHECPVCYRVFSSGQALGGHKRSHVISSESRIVTNSAKFRESTLIDLNLPAPVDDDYDEQFELSAVSDALDV